MNNLGFGASKKLNYNSSNRRSQPLLQSQPTTNEEIACIPLVLLKKLQEIDIKVSDSLAVQRGNDLVIKGLHPIKSGNSSLYNFVVSQQESLLKASNLPNSMSLDGPIGFIGCGH